MQNLLFVFQDGAYVKKSDIDGLGLCPYDPRHNSTAVFAGKFLHLSKLINRTIVRCDNDQFSRDTIRNQL